MKTVPTQRTWQKWLGRGFFAILDQAIFGFAHLCIHILAARWMTIDAYGRFAGVYALIVLGHMVHNAFIIEPSLVFGSTDDSTRKAVFTADVVKLNFHLSSALLAVGAVVAVLGLFIIRHPLVIAVALSLTAVALLSPFWLVRRLFYLSAASGKAALTTAAYASACLSALLTLQYYNVFTYQSAVAVMAIAGALTGGVVLLLTQRQIENIFVWPTSIALGFASYGRWAVGSAVLIWAISNAYYLVLPLLASAADAGSFRAIVNLFLPIQHALVGTAALLLPIFSRRVASRKPFALRNWLSPAVLLMSVGCIYSLVIYLGGAQILFYAYDGKYAEVLPALTPALLLPPAWAIIIYCNTVLRSLNKPRAVFQAHMFVAIFLASWLVPLSATQGFYSSMWGFGILQTGLVAAVLFRSWIEIKRVQPEIRDEVPISSTT